MCLATPSLLSAEQMSCSNTNTTDLFFSGSCMLKKQYLQVQYLEFLSQVLLQGKVIQKEHLYTQAVWNELTPVFKKNLLIFMQTCLLLNTIIVDTWINLVWSIHPSYAKFLNTSWPSCFYLGFQLPVICLCVHTPGSLYSLTHKIVWTRTNYKSCYEICRKYICKTLCSFSLEHFLDLSWEELLCTN